MFRYKIPLWHFLLHISLKNKAVGTCSNEKGYFKFVIDSAYIKDTIVISSIGYKNYLFTPSSLSNKDSIFYLEPANYEIKAAVIINNAPSADKIIKHVLRNYGKNYPRSGYQAKAFFQDIVYCNHRRNLIFSKVVKQQNS